MPATLALDRAYLADLHGDADRAFWFASRALTELAGDEWMLATHTAGYTALADWLRVDLPEAARLLSSCIDRWLSASQLHLATCGWCSRSPRNEPVPCCPARA